MAWLLGKLAIRLVAFTAVFWLATRPRKGDGPDAPARPPRITIQPRWAIPLIGGLFAALNVGLYWVLRPVLNLATLGAFSLVMPLVVNGLLLWGTTRVVARRQWLRVDGLMAAGWLVGALTVAHGVLWFALDWIPAR